MSVSFLLIALKGSEYTSVLDAHPSGNAASFTYRKSDEDGGYNFYSHSSIPSTSFPHRPVRRSLIVDKLVQRYLFTKCIYS